VPTSSTVPTEEQTKRQRLSIDLDPKAKQMVDDLAARSGGITNAELFRRSLALYNAVLTLHERKGVVVFRHEDGTEERLLML
jgi:hypothetical protein